MIETLDDIIEEVLNRLYIYGTHDETAEDCQCRCCEASSLKQRILKAVELQNDLDKSKS